MNQNNQKVEMIMSEEQEIIEPSFEVTDLIQHALDQDYNKANKVFGDMMGVKVNDLLDQEKIKLADQIFNDVDPEDDDEEDDEDDTQGELDLEAEGEFESDESGDEEEDEAEDEEEDVADEEDGDVYYDDEDYNYCDDDDDDYANEQ